MALYTTNIDYGVRKYVSEKEGPIIINLQKDSHFRLRRSNTKLIEYRASIDGRNPILSNRLSSSLCSRRIGVELNERHNKTAQSSSLLTFCEFEAHCFPA